MDNLEQIVKNYLKNDVEDLSGGDDQIYSKTQIADAFIAGYNQAINNNKDTVWCLFSIANNYDQPRNNLEKVWATKPTFKEFSEESEDIEWSKKLYAGEKVEDWNHTQYRFEEIKTNTWLINEW